MPTRHTRAVGVGSLARNQHAAARVGAALTLASSICACLSKYTPQHFGGGAALHSVLAALPSSVTHTSAVSAHARDQALPRVLGGQRFRKGLAVARSRQDGGCFQDKGRPGGERPGVLSGTHPSSSSGPGMAGHHAAHVYEAAAVGGRTGISRRQRSCLPRVRARAKARRLSWRR